MKKTTLLVIVFAFLFNTQLIISQEPISFQNFTIEMPSNMNGFSWNDLSQYTANDTGYYVILQFERTPNQNVQNEFRNRGIALKNYVSNSSYFVYVPNNMNIDFFKTSGVVSIVSVPKEFKMSSKIRNGEIGTWAQQGDNVLVDLVYHASMGFAQFESQVSNIQGVSILNQTTAGNMVTLSVPSNKLEQVSLLSATKWMELIHEPDIKDDNRGRSLHRSSNLDTQTLAGRNYTGEGIGVMVRDDGIVGPHVDFQGRIDNSEASGSAQTHGDGVAGIMAGAGNIDPRLRGMAAGSNVFVVNYVPSFLDTPTLDFINNGDVQITNSSYSNGCNAGYTNSANTVDAQSNNIPTLLHVFSAGNSNGSDCGYGAGNQWGNITGGHKQGKNVIATANTFFNGQLANSSSRGPAYDGRIKPDITAHGQGQLSTDENNGYLSFGGTSAAAPSIAGVAAQLYQLYKEENAGQLPEAALIKAALLNTANDYGNTGPDFRFGWGMVNALRAGMLLEDGRYLSDEIAEGGANQHTLSVPANTTQIKVMLYWSDPEAITGAATALVNDLDLEVTSPSSQVTQPWVLNSTPNAALLASRASRGIDRLNNVEQVLIDNPEAGDYTIDVSAFNIPVGPQKYYLVYEVITEELTLTYPNGGEKLAVGEQIPVHWDAVNTTDSFLLEYSSDNGATWNNMVNLPGSVTNYNWTVPSNVSGETLVRITSGSFTDQSDDVFSIANQVSGISITQVCPDSMTITWDALADADEYDVYFLGDKFMEVVGTTSNTTFDIPITDPEGDLWVSVSARGGATNWETLRSNAVNENRGLVNCPLNIDLSVTELTDNFSNLVVLCNNNSIQVEATISNQGTDLVSGFTVSYQLNSGAIVEEPFTGAILAGNQAVHTFSAPLSITQDGDQQLKVWVTAGGDEYTGNDDFDRAFFAQLDPYDLNTVEDFQAVEFLPVGWVVNNPDGGAGWVPSNVNGPQGPVSRGIGVNHFIYTAVGEEDSFTTLAYDLDGTGLALSFDLAKAQFSSTRQDGLRVEISTDCGATFTSIYEKNDLELSTVSDYVSGANLWLPGGPSDWRTETIDLSAYAGENAQFRFTSINRNGNTTLLDNIAVSGILSASSENFDDNFSLFPNPVLESFTLRSTRVNVEKLEIFSLLGKKVKIVEIDESEELITVDITDLPSGVYIVRLESELGSSYKKIIKS